MAVSSRQNKWATWTCREPFPRDMHQAPGVPTQSVERSGWRLLAESLDRHEKHRPTAGKVCLRDVRLDLCDGRAAEEGTVHAGLLVNPHAREGGEGPAVQAGATRRTRLVCGVPEPGPSASSHGPGMTMVAIADTRGPIGERGSRTCFTTPSFGEVTWALKIIRCSPTTVAPSSCCAAPPAHPAGGTAGGGWTFLWPLAGERCIVVEERLEGNDLQTDTQNGRSLGASGRREMANVGSELDLI